MRSKGDEMVSLICTRHRGEK